LALPQDGEIWFSYCSKVRDVALSMLAVSEISVAGDTLAQPEVFAAALLSRSLLNLRGVVVTAQAGLVVEAGTLSRRCVESSLWMRQLHQDGEGFSKAILDDSEHNMAGLARKISAAVLSGFDENELAVIVPFLTKKKTKRISADGGVPTDDGDRDYGMFKLLSNTFAHPSALALSRHIGADPTTGQAELAVEPAVVAADFHGLFLYAVLAVLSVMESYSDIVHGQPISEDIATLEVEFAAMKEHIEGTQAK
jgi:hypothetical protein